MAQQPSGRKVEIREVSYRQIEIYIRGTKRRAEEEFVIRPVRPGDFMQLVQLQREVYPPPYPRSAHWTPELIQQHLQRFPEGQFCIEYINDGTLVGSATTMRIKRTDARRRHTYAGMTGDGTLSTHDPNGNAIYGVDICVAPHFRGKGLARSLYERRFQLMRELGLRFFLAGARIPGFHRHKDTMTAEIYIQKVTAGEIFDPTLSVQLKAGFHVVTILPRYMRDPESDNHAVLIEYEEAAVEPPAPAPAAGAKSDEAPMTSPDAGASAKDNAAEGKR